MGWLWIVDEKALLQAALFHSYYTIINKITWAFKEKPNLRANKLNCIQQASCWWSRAPTTRTLCKAKLNACAKAQFLKTVVKRRDLHNLLLCFASKNFSCRSCSRRSDGGQELRKRRKIVQCFPSLWFAPWFLHAKWCKYAEVFRLHKQRWRSTRVEFACRKKLQSISKRAAANRRSYVKSQMEGQVKEAGS